MPLLEHLPAARFEGPGSDNPFAFRHYDADKMVLGKRMADHLRLAVCYWHSFVWPGVDVFGASTFDRPWHKQDDAMEMAHMKADAAFEFFARLSTPFYTFHDTDVAPEGASIREYVDNFKRMRDYLARKQEASGVKLLWGTANLFSNPRYAAGAATNPNPDVFAFAATQVREALQATLDLGGENYVLWGGREGYETLLNTDLKHERQQLARLLAMVAEHKHKIGFKGALLIEPKPQEPTKHQYDYDVATVHGFLMQFGLQDEFRVNIEANHATLAGHSFHHEIATAFALGIFGSIDANRGDPQNGWDTDQFPNSVEELTLALYEILRNGGFTTGGMNFDSKVRRQSIDAEDLLHGHIGAIDMIAVALERAATLVEKDQLAELKAARYAGWNAEFGQKVLAGGYSLDTLATDALSREIDPRHVSGQQERLENIVNRAIYG
ncbi:D-xylose isomerase [Burkholderia sp. 8Y]|uniref:xylose isomerase n=1 Tax=Burkholderia sp. 8Y TaxID=2653133 RepID=UPI0012F019EE|nr:xylose isomerase [Burkholderia sp. 8Y]VXC74241.1 D-xylose isomerase [Burkholderia sp. 8Y]